MSMGAARCGKDRQGNITLEQNIWSACIKLIYLSG